MVVMSYYQTMPTTLGVVTPLPIATGMLRRMGARSEVAWHGRNGQILRDVFVAWCFRRNYEWLGPDSLTKPPWVAGLLMIESDCKLELLG